MNADDITLDDPNWIQLTPEEAQLIQAHRDARAAEETRIAAWRPAIDELLAVYTETESEDPSAAAVKRFIQRACQCGIEIESGHDFDLVTFAQSLIEALGLEPTKVRGGWRWARTA